jgi:hypothetical protein
MNTLNLEALAVESFVTDPGSWQGAPESTSGFESTSQWRPCTP